MTRQEFIKQQAKLLCNTVSPEEYFIMGAEWADRHPDISIVSALAYEAGRNDVIKEACEWIMNHFSSEGFGSQLYYKGLLYRPEDIVEDFKKYMKGE